MVTLDLDAMTVNPYPFFAALRAEELWTWSDQLQMYLVSRYDDVVYVDENPGIFSLQVPGNLMSRTVGRAAMVRQDGAVHERLRTASGDALKRRTVQRDWQAMIAGLVGKLVAPLRGRSSADLIADVASPLTSACLREVLGLLDAAPADIQRWSAAFIAGLINNNDDPAVWAAAKIAAGEVRDSVTTALERVRREPDGTVIAAMSAAHPADPLSAEEISANIRLMISGGFNDGRDALATLAWLLMRHPGARERSAADPAAFERAIDESVRWLTPIGSYPRVLTRDFTSPAGDLKAGDRLLVLAASANHDEGKFAEPGRFDIGRPNLDQHLAFSIGAHYCLGNQLVRGMMRAMVPAVLALPGIRPAADPEFTGWQFRGPVSVPVVLEPAARGDAAVITRNRYELCATASVPDDGIVRIDEVPGFSRSLAVVHSGGEFYCIDDTCSHQEASLSDGWVEDGCVECPLHESRFNVRTGNPDVPPARHPIRTYPVEVAGGAVYLLGEPG